ncbi:MAG: cyclic nucleotide-binding domain-containing protein [Candidatus Hydrogenedentes bacterium]|nr:cyclic nucleotide-binding domain-containing protein [Candidatus Hydrogenedentota bacterium]
MSEDRVDAVPERRQGRVADSLPPCIAALPVRALPAGEVLIEENSVSGALYFLDSGTLEVRKDAVQLAEVSEVGAVFGEMSVLLRTVHTAAVIASTDVEVRVAMDPELFLRDNPEVALYVARILARRLNSLNRYLVDIKHQFSDMDDHLGMVDEVLGALMNKHPRDIDRRRRS